MPRPKKTPPHDPSIAIAYFGPGIPTLDQRSAVEATAARVGVRIVGTFYDSAPAPLPDRDGFVDALSEIEGRGAGTLLTASVAVLASTAAEHALVLRAVERGGARWVPADPGVPWLAAAVEEALSAIRQHESLMYRPKVRLGMRGGREARPGGPPPWGFRRGEGGQFEPDAREQKAIQRMLKMRDEGASLGDIATFIQELALPGRGPKVFRATIKAIFQRLDRSKP